jgi:hypothetical protein
MAGDFIVALEDEDNNRGVDNKKLCLSFFTRSLLRIT